ncbi:hypothetical protein JW926_17490, partial [Candidatus Sumerlaeota bacterium]|nr:hypothetical protein [Candidatus Sumerlaeota bacterium]
FTKLDEGIATVIIETAPDIYPVQPWVATRDYSDRYARLNTKKIDTDKWEFSYDMNKIDIAVVGVCDQYGNVTLEEVCDGSRRISAQSEFYRCNPRNINIETNASKAVLIDKRGGAALPQKSSPTPSDHIKTGAMSYEYDALSVVDWKGAKITGEVPSGASIKTRYRFADTPKALKEAVWTKYFETMSVNFDGNFYGRIAECEVILDSSGSGFPTLDSFEIFYQKKGAKLH